MGSLMLFTQFGRLEAAPLRASPCTLAWDTTSNPVVSGYAVYYGVRGSAATNRLDVGLTNQVTFKNLYAATNYFFYLASYCAWGMESSPSAMMYYTPSVVSSLKAVPLVNGTMSIRFQAATNASCHVEFTPSLAPAQWQTLGTATADANGNVTITDPLTGKPSKRFYRAAVP